MTSQLLLGTAAAIVLASCAQSKEKVVVTVHVPPDGPCYFGSEMAPCDKIGVALIRAFPDKALTVLIAADRRTSFRRVADTTYNIEEAGVENVGYVGGDIIDTSKQRVITHEPADSQGSQ